VSKFHGVTASDSECERVCCIVSRTVSEILLCICHIIALDMGVPLFIAFVCGQLREYHQELCIAKNHQLWATFCRRQYWYSFSYFDAVSSETYHYGSKPPKNGNNRSQCRSRSFKVTYAGTSGKPIYDFLLVNHTNLHRILNRFRDFTGYWSNFCCW